MFSFILTTVYEILALNKFNQKKKKNLTSFSHNNKPIIVHFAFLPLEAAFHEFNTLLLISYDPIARFRSNFFQTVCSHKAYPLKGFLELANCRCRAPQTRKAKILGK